MTAMQAVQTVLELDSPIHDHLSKRSPDRDETMTIIPPIPRKKPERTRSIFAGIAVLLALSEPPTEQEPSGSVETKNLTPKEVGTASSKGSVKHPYQLPAGLTVYRIFELLSDRDSRTIYLNRGTGESFMLNSARQLNRVSGISNTVVHHLLDTWKKDGRWVELQQDTFVRLAHLLSVIDPSLTDTKDKTQSPIRFADRIDTDTGLLKRAWQQLAELHAQDAPHPQDILLNDADRDLRELETLSSKNETVISTSQRSISFDKVSEKERRAIRDLILRSLESEEKGKASESLSPRQQIPFEIQAGKMTQFSCDRLIELIDEDMDKLGLTTLEAYVEHLLSRDRAAAEARGLSSRAIAHNERQKRPALTAGLQLINGGTIPGGEMYSTTMRLLAQYIQEPRCNGDVQVLIDACGRDSHS